MRKNFLWQMLSSDKILKENFLKIYGLLRNMCKFGDVQATAKLVFDSSKWAGHLANAL